ncbi:Probable Co/Zn/Cd efflux system membrane fusion protein [hydrothermal vent metagenome]|uniref:Probable Co/Zn/Cd efflux system membrane fusion protein n=1 Tax=hydrothermal vent metagenome TaxID=652676 RepID=A0A3B1BX97_9ZZZZ
MKKICMVVIVGAFLTGLVVSCSNDKAKNGAERAQTHKVVRGDLIVSVSASGVIEPNFQVEVKSKASGKILEFDMEPGDAVKKGKTLIVLDPRVEKRNLAQQEAGLARVLSELESDKASLRERQLKLKRAMKLFERKLVSEQELDSAKASADMASARIGEVKAVIARARIVVDDAKERLGDTVIVSPIDGVLVEKSVEKGQIISSGITSFAGGTKLCVIADLSRMFIFAQVDETDIGKVFDRQKVNVSVDAYPDKSFEGVVRRIYPTGETSDNITVFKVKIEVLDLSTDKAPLRPKMTANVDIIIDRRENTLIIPEDALRAEDSQAGKLSVLVKEGEKTVKRKVTAGLSNGFETEILTGLKEGETVVVGSLSPND